MLTPSPAFHVTFAYGASFKVFTISVVISSEGNVLIDSRCFPSLFCDCWNDKLEFFVNIPFWLIWLKSYMILDYKVGVNGRTELFTIHIGQNDRSFWEGFLYYVWTLIWWCELSSHVWKGHVPLFQDEVSQLKGTRLSLLVVSSFDSPLVELFVTQCRQSFLVYKVQLLIVHLGPLCFI